MALPQGSVGFENRRQRGLPAAGHGIPPCGLAHQSQGGLLPQQVRDTGRPMPGIGPLTHDPGHPVHHVLARSARIADDDRQTRRLSLENDVTGSVGTTGKKKHVSGCESLCDRAPVTNAGFLSRQSPNVENDGAPVCGRQRARRTGDGREG